MNLNRDSCQRKINWKWIIDQNVKGKIIKLQLNIGNMLELVHCWWDHKTLWLSWKMVWRLPTKWRILLSCDPAVVPLRVLKEVEAYIHIKRSTRLFREAFFLTAKTWKQPRYPSIGEWIQKQRYSRIRGGLQCYKGISSQAKMTLGGFKHILVKEVSLKRSHSIWFQL